MEHISFRIRMTGNILNDLTVKLTSVTLVAKSWKKSKRGTVAERILNSPRLPTEAHDTLLAGMRDLEAGTCLKFVERTKQRDYIDFYVGAGCHSQVGRKGGKQEISLANACWHSHIVCHEVSCLTLIRESWKQIQNAGPSPRAFRGKQNPECSVASFVIVSVLWNFSGERAR